MVRGATSKGLTSAKLVLSKLTNCFLHCPLALVSQASERMATRQKTRKKQKEQEEKEQREAEQRQKELAEAVEYLDGRRADDGQERFWSAESAVRLRTFTTEERIKNSPEGQVWNPRFLLEAKEELERRRAALEEEERMQLEEEEEQRRAGEEREARVEKLKERIKHSISLPIQVRMAQAESEERLDGENGSRRMNEAEERRLQVASELEKLREGIKQSISSIQIPVERRTTEADKDQRRLELASGLEEVERLQEEEERGRVKSRERIKCTVSQFSIQVRSELNCTEPEGGDQRRMQLEAELEKSLEEDQAQQIQIPVAEPAGGQQLEEYQRVEQLEAELEEVERVQLEMVEEKKQRVASEEKRRIRGEERERIRLRLETVTKWLEKCDSDIRWQQEIFNRSNWPPIGPIGPMPAALAREIQSERQFERELERHFGFPPPTGGVGGSAGGEGGEAGGESEE